MTVPLKKCTAVSLDGLASSAEEQMMRHGSTVAHLFGSESVNNGTGSENILVQLS